MIRTASIILGFLFCSATLPAVAQPRCSAPEYSQFDFWVGEWEVRAGPDNAVAGANTIEKKHGGCVLQESYETPQGFSGESLNIYDARREVWHQTWVDNSGLLLVLEGGLVDGSMVLQSASGGSEDTATRHRITWTPNEDGTVRQLWESTDDSGEWVVAFDGLYSRK